ncbi:MAG: AAA family ATPase [Gemmatimonadetes bacterium]|nr:AAA family ATPase [Gemmatimonadota bacterium]
MRAGDLDDAVRRYTGDFFGTFASPGADEFERWADVERARLRALFVHAAESLARRALDRGRSAEAIALAHRIREVAPLVETGWQLLLESLSASGDVIGARAEADHFERWLESEDHVPEPASVAALRLARHVRAFAPQAASAGELTTDLVGRELDFSTLHDLWMVARAKGARTALVTGEGGIGKSRLVHDLRARIVAARGRVVWSAVRAGDRHVAYSALADLASELAAMPGAAGISQHSAAALLALDPSLSTRFSGGADTADGDEALRRRSLALLELIAAVADDAPFTLVIDDLHWCDDESLRALSFVAERLRAERVLLVLTARPTRPLPTLGEQVVTLRLAPLTEEQVELLVASMAPLPRDPWAATLATRLRRCSGGFPLLVLEALRLSLERGVLQLADDGWHCASEEELDLTLQQGAVVGRRLGTLQPQESRVLSAIAAAEMPLAEDLLPAAADLDATVAATASTTLELRGLIRATGGGWRVAHDEIGGVALSLLAPDALGATHLRLAEVLGTAPDANARRRALRHFVAAKAWSRAAELVRTILRETPRRIPLDDELRAMLGDELPAAERAQIVATLPFSVRHPAWRRTMQVGGAIAAVAALVVFARDRFMRALPPEAELTVAYADPAGGALVHRIGVSMRDWDETRPIDAVVTTAAEHWRASPTAAPDPVWSPTGDEWAADEAFADSGGLDVVII